ncbi:MAG: acetyl-CoA carboxylase biotin carboxyl carrier protein [Clostridia bacterium]|nr:acetyl-CoA carboxylase biotin carboxyl carrier protein [Clostridia bacterium]
MEYEKIKKIMDDMEKSTLTELSIDFSDGTKVCMKKESAGEKNIVRNEEIVAENKVTISKDITTNTVQDNSKIAEGNIVKSPMVGTFYSKPSPDSAPYVEIGQRVKKGDTLCIIEAMKLMNEIESEFDGVVKDILAQDGEAIEYGKELFVIS